MGVSVETVLEESGARLSRAQFVEQAAVALEELFARQPHFVGRLRRVVERAAHGRFLFDLGEHDRDMRTEPRAGGAVVLAVVGVGDHDASVRVGFIHAEEAELQALAAVDAAVFVDHWEPRPPEGGSLGGWFLRHIDRRGGRCGEAVGADGLEDRLGGVAAQVVAFDLGRHRIRACASEQSAHGARMAGDDGEPFGGGDEISQPGLAPRGQARPDTQQGVAGYRVYIGADPEGSDEWFTAEPAVKTAPLAPGRYLVRVQTIDKAGNTSPWATIGAVVVSAP